MQSSTLRFSALYIEIQSAKHDGDVIVVVILLPRSVVVPGVAVLGSSDELDADADADILTTLMAQLDNDPVY